MVLEPPSCISPQLDQLVKDFILEFGCYEYDQVYDEIDYLRKQDEPVRDFNIRFHLKCLQYDLEDELTDEESLDYDECFLPLVPDQNGI